VCIDEMTGICLNASTRTNLCVQVSERKSLSTAAPKLTLRGLRSESGGCALDCHYVARGAVIQGRKATALSAPPAMSNRPLLDLPSEHRDCQTPSIR